MATSDPTALIPVSLNACRYARKHQECQRFALDVSAESCPHVHVRMGRTEHEGERKWNTDLNTTW